MAGGATGNSGVGSMLLVMVPAVVTWCGACCVAIRSSFPVLLGKKYKWNTDDTDATDY